MAHHMNFVKSTNSSRNTRHTGRMYNPAGEEYEDINSGYRGHRTPQHETFGRVAIGIARNLGWNYLWDSKNNCPISFQDAWDLQDDQNHIKLFPDNDPFWTEENKIWALEKAKGTQS